jgi:glycosyltransferase involved in cell wall biosynthesis
MKIAIDTSPLQNESANRGIGYYTKRLIDGLKARSDGNEYILTKSSQEIETSKPDLIHYPFFDLFILTLPPRKNTPVVVTIHDVIPLVLPDMFPPGIKGKLKFQFQKNRISKVDKIITDSICSKKDITEKLGISDEKIEVVYLACDEKYQRVTDTKKLEEVKKKYDLPDKYILRVGDINKHKNFSILFDALTRSSDIHLVLVGKALSPDAPLIPELKEIRESIQVFSLQKRVHTIGFVPDEDIASIYTLAHGSIHNSLYEGFGLPALESMSCKTPVITSETGSLPEISGSAGIMINPYDVLDTSKAIQKLWGMDPQKYSELQEKCYQQSRKFSLKKMVDETVFVYESI